VSIAKIYFMGLKLFGYWLLAIDRVHGISWNLKLPLATAASAKEAISIMNQGTRNLEPARAAEASA
jgi:hypothetical protein